MFWETDEKEQEFVVPDDIIDLAFSIECRSLPIDHAWALSQAMQEQLPWLGNDPGTGLHLIHGAESGNGWERPDDPDEEMFLSRRTPLVVRVPKSRELEAASLVGKTLALLGTTLKVGNYKRRLLSSSSSLYARHVVVAAGMDEEALIQQAVKEIQAHGVQFKKVVMGKSTALKTPQGNLTVTSMLVAELSKPDSVRLQQLGIGEHQQMGCGLFIPHKTV